MPDRANAKTESPCVREYPVGAEVTTEGVDFSVWAPRRKRVHVALVDQAGEVRTTHDLAPGDRGYFAGTVSEASPGD
jgi:1,4-alpha-glucan branching enzyme